MSVVLGEPSEAARDDGHARAPALGARRASGACSRSGGGGRVAEAAIEHRDERAELVPRRAAGAHGSRGSARAPPGVGAGRARGAAVGGHARGQRERAGGRAGGPPRGPHHVVRCTRSGYSAGRIVGPRGPLDVAPPPRHPARGHPDRSAGPRAAAAGQMIVTVTLNAAIDKTLAVPNFRLGRRHRAVEQTAMAGGKGVNVARALKALGQPVIATGRGGRSHRHAHHRGAHRRGHPQRLPAHHARSRAPPPRSSIPPPASRRRSTSTGRSCPSPSSSTSSRSCSTWPRAPHCACFPAASRAAWIRASTDG